MSWLAQARVEREAAARLSLFDSYAWHQVAWEAFPGREDKEREFLHRLDMKSDAFQLLLLSRTQPSRPSWCAEDDWKLTRIPPAFLEHSCYRFDLIANPTRKIVKLGDEGKPTKNGKREALMKVEDQAEWLHRKGIQGGFHVLDAPPMQIDRAGAGQFAIKGRRERGTHISVRFRGILEVKGREEFRKTFFEGVGSAKAFGFGMLVLQPVAGM